MLSVGRGLKVWIRKELDGLKGRVCIVDAKVLIALALHCVGLCGVCYSLGFVTSLYFYRSPLLL